MSVGLSKIAQLSKCLELGMSSLSISGAPRSTGSLPHVLDSREAASINFGDLFHSCPVEIVREIFEFAAQDTVAGACILALVSKDVRQWTAPCLYQTLVITKPSHIESIISNSLSLPGASRFLAQHVHNLAFAWSQENTISMWDDDVMQGMVWLLRECRSLQSLLADFIYIPQLVGLMVALPHLKRVHSLDSILPLPKLLVAQVTHLYTRVASPLDMLTHLDRAWGFPLRLPPWLSHIGYHVMVVDPGDYKTLSDIAFQILQAQSIVKLVITIAHESDVRPLPTQPMFMDKRLCFLLGGAHRENIVRDWEMEARGSISFWNRESQMI